MTHLRLVPQELYSVRVDAPRVTGQDLARYAQTAADELAAALAEFDLNKQIAAERRLIAIGGLAQIHANHLEKGTPA